MSGNWNEYNLNPLTSNNWRASLVPTAAVIPAPIAYIKVVEVKKLVVGSRDAPCRPSLADGRRQASRVVGTNRRRAALRARSAGGPACQPGRPSATFLVLVPSIELVGTYRRRRLRASSAESVSRRFAGGRSSGAQIVYREKIRVFKAGRPLLLPPNT